MNALLASVFSGTASVAAGDGGDTPFPWGGVLIPCLTGAIVAFSTWLMMRPWVTQGGRPKNLEEEQPRGGQQDRAPVAEDGRGNDVGASLEERYIRLARHMASAEVRTEDPGDVDEEPQKLSPNEVAQVFRRHVPGVDGFLYRGQRHNSALRFVQSVYEHGFQAFEGTSLHVHLLTMLRLIVHYGHADGADAAAFLREVAEAFMDCQAVQARVVDKVGSRIRGVRKDFRGHVVSLVAEYRSMALRMLAYEAVTALGGPDLRQDPNHFENRLIIDIGLDLGFSFHEIQRAWADPHVNRWHPVSSPDAACERVRQLFDVGALVKALVAELSAFDEASDADSTARQFLEWSEQAVVRRHDILDEETCAKISIDEEVALAVLETLFFGRPSCRDDGPRHRGMSVRSLFKDQPSLP